MQHQALALSLFAAISIASAAQPPAFTSPEVTPDRHVEFRIFAPKAQAVRLFSTDMFGMAPKGEMTKAENGVWEIAVGPIDPGAYRYNFNVDGVSVMDPRNASVSESNGNAWSMVYVPGADFMETKDVPHGAVASVTYYSKSLGRFRRMHVYTPPGYETGSQKYPDLLSAARRGRLGRFVDVSGPRGLHHRQSDRRQESQADGDRDAGRPHRTVQF